MFNLSRRQQQFNHQQRRQLQHHPFSLNRNDVSVPERSNNLQAMFKQVTKPGNLSNIANKSLGNLNKTLSNVQKVAQVVQSATPIVQEYGPLVKNLPAMYRMMKAINSVEEDEKENTPTNKLSKETQPGTKVQKKDEVSQGSRASHQSYQGQSTPKLFY